MSEALKEIMRPLPEDFVRRMRNWARAKAGSSLSYASVRWGLKVSGEGCGAPLPIMEGEADDTDRALQTLDVRYRRAVELFWAWEETELAVLARKCGGIEYRTYAKRVIDGHVLLRAELFRQAEAWRARRDAAAVAVRKNEIRLDVRKIPV